MDRRSVSCSGELGKSDDDFMELESCKHLESSTETDPKLSRTRHASPEPVRQQVSHVSMYETQTVPSKILQSEAMTRIEHQSGALRGK